MFILTVAARGGTEGTGRGEQVLLSSPGAFSTPLKVIFVAFPGRERISGLQGYLEGKGWGWSCCLPPILGMQEGPAGAPAAEGNSCCYPELPNHHSKG